MKKIGFLILLCASSFANVYCNKTHQDSLSVADRLKGMLINHGVTERTYDFGEDTITSADLKRLHATSLGNIKFINKKYTFPPEIYRIDSIKKRTHNKYEMWVRNLTNKTTYLIIAINNNDGSQKNKIKLNVGEKYLLTLRTIYPNPDPSLDLALDSVFAKSLSLGGQRDVKAPIFIGSNWNLTEYEEYELGGETMISPLLAWRIFEILELKDEYYIEE